MGIIDIIGEKVSRKHWLVLASIWMITIVYFSLTGANNIPDFKILTFDKLIHLLIYLILVVLFILGLELSSSGKILLAVLASLLGAALEYMQLFMHVGRHFDYADMLANTVGAFIALILFFRKKNIKSWT